MRSRKTVPLHGTYITWLVRGEVAQFVHSHIGGVALGVRALVRLVEVLPHHTQHVHAAQQIKEIHLWA